MVWYLVLMVLTILFSLIAAISFFLGIVGDCPEIITISLIAVILALGTGCGSWAIEKENTTVDTEVVQMTVTKCDITSVVLNGRAKYDYYVTAGNEYLIKVTEEEYVKLNVGDVVTIEVTTKTIFGEVKNPTAKLGN